MSTLTVYWRPGCGYCRRLRRALGRAGVDYEAIDIWQNPDAAAFVRSVAGGDETVPTVCLDDQVWVNPDPRDLLRDVRDTSPALIRNRPARRIGLPGLVRDLLRSAGPSRLGESHPKGRRARTRLLDLWSEREK